MTHHKYIAIEGVIGVGKTTLARLMQAPFQASVLLEIFEENPFLASFYQDRDRLAFQTQLFFLLSRYHQQHQAVPLALQKGHLITDYTFAKDELFAWLNLKDDELAMYGRVHAALSEKIPMPDLIVYLHADHAVTMRRIALRDRPYERDMDPTYIQNLAKAYEAWLANLQETAVLTIDTTHLDFLANPADLENILNQINAALASPNQKNALPTAEAQIRHLQNGRLPAFQQFHRALDQSKGFDPDLFLNYILLTEEVGELAKELVHVWGEAQLLQKEGYTPEEAHRAAVGNHQESLRNELADLLAYTLKLANYSGIDLEQAYMEKMQKNIHRQCPANEPPILVRGFLMNTQPLPNYVNGRWQTADVRQTSPIHNPATNDLLGQVPLSNGRTVDEAVQAAHAALPAWRRVPPGDRIQPLFLLKMRLEECFEELAILITQECGKTLAESRGELRRAIENVEVACGIPMLLQSEFLENVAEGVDEFVVRQPVGVCAIIAPFNFPAMIPFWFLPYAIACGNTCVVKPSDRTPLTMLRVFQMLDELGLPPGVVNMVHGGQEAAEALLDHPHVAAVSFVGSTAVARHIYARASASGKRVQAQGGAKNPVIILPDADMTMTTRIVADSAFGCAGQRCLAASLAITVGEAQRPFSQAIATAATERITGYGLNEQTQMGPVISHTSKNRIEGLIQQAEAEGAEVLVDGRSPNIAGFAQGSFVRPTILQAITPASTLAQTEVFGPVLGLLHVNTIEEAIQLVNKGRYGNMACLFTSSGVAARQFRHEAEAGNIGINIGVAAPMAYFPFSGWKESFFGTLHGQSKHAVEFFTQTKVVVERWPQEWKRTF